MECQPGCGSGRLGERGVGVGHTLSYLVNAGWVDRYDARWSVSQDVEVGGGWGTHRGGATVGIHLVVDQAPLLQECVHPEHKAIKLTSHQRVPQTLPLKHFHSRWPMAALRMTFFTSSYNT